MSGAVAALACLAAFALLGLATERHDGERFGRRPPPPLVRRWRVGAAVLLALAFAAAVAAWGWAIGPVAWFGLVMAGAAASFLGLNLVHPRRPARQAPPG